MIEVGSYVEAGEQDGYDFGVVYVDPATDKTRVAWHSGGDTPLFGGERVLTRLEYIALREGAEPTDMSRAFAAWRKEQNEHDSWLDEVSADDGPIDGYDY